MANRNLRVVGHFTDANGNTLGALGTVVANVSAAMAVGSDGLERHDPVAIKNVFSSNGKIPGGAAKFVICPYGAYSPHKRIQELYSHYFPFAYRA